MFLNAGRLYTRMEKPYGLMMLWCTGSLGGRSDESFHRVVDNVERLQLPYMLLSSVGEGGNSLRLPEFAMVRERLAGSENYPMGVLGILVGAYLDLAFSLSSVDRHHSRVLESLLPFLYTYSNTMRRCMEDKFHLKRMAFPFHPIEPDISAYFSASSQSFAGTASLCSEFSMRFHSFRSQ
jgi:hypothetical protein